MAGSDGPGLGVDEAQSVPGPVARVLPGEGPLAAPDAGRKAHPGEPVSWGAREGSEPGQAQGGPQRGGSASAAFPGTKRLVPRGD